MPANVTFVPGDTEETITFTATQDQDNDDGESVKLSFGNTLPTGVSAGTTDEAVVTITDDDVPAVRVSFERSSYRVDEGSLVTVKVTLNADPERTVTIPITTTDQDGASSADYSGVPASVTFNADDTEVDINFTATQDQDNDDGESVKLGFGNTLPTGVSAGNTDEAVVTITDDDVPSVRVSFEQGSYSVDEGDTVDVTVTLSEDPERTVTVPLTTTDQDGVSSADYSGVPANVIFVPGDTEQTFTFTATQDQDNDDGESVKLTFGNLPAGVSAGTTDEAMVNITDDDVPSVVVSFEQSSYSVDEGDTVDVTVTLSEDPERTVTIPLTTTDQDGASSADYSGVPANVTFVPGDTEETITFTATQDQDNDDGESVKLSFGNTLPTGVSAGTTDEAVVTITDDDVPAVRVSFERSSYRVDEGSLVTVKVTLNADPERTVTIPITTTDQDGASSADYSGVPASVTFNADDTEVDINFTATQDQDNDDGESVKLGFGNTLPTGVSAGNTDEAVVTITDDDVPSVRVSFEQGSYSVDEGDTVDVTVTLSEDPERTVTVPLTKTDQDGASSADYSGVPASVEFAPGETEQTFTFTFTATQDQDNDDGESVKLTFGNTLPTGVSAGNTDEAVVTITDDDVPSVEVSFEQGTYTVAEGSLVTVKVTLNADPERTVTIPITTTDQGGASSADYSGVPANVTFNAGDTEVDINFSASSDSVDDNGESVKLAFGNTLPTGVSAGNTDEAVVTITDDDAPSVEVSFEQGTYTVAEGSLVTVTVTLNADPERTVTIPITTTDQGGASSADYSGVPLTLTFNSGDTEAEITFAADSDSDNDNGESVKLGFGALPTGVSAGTTNEATVSITDDDLPSVTANFEQASYTVSEGDAVDVTVTLSEDPEQSVTIPLSTTNQGGASDSDYSGVPASVTFSSGETEKTFAFTAADDYLEDGGESVKLSFGILPDRVSAGTTDEATVSISNSIAQNSLTVTFDFSEQVLSEGGTATVTVRLNIAPGSDVTIPLTKTEQDGASSADYSGVPDGVEFTSEETEKTFDFMATQDDVDDDGKSVKIGFGSLPGGVTVGDTAETIVSITDDDTADLVVSPSSLDIGEAGSGTFTVKLATQPSLAVTVSVTSGDTGAATVSQASLSFSAATWNDAQTVTVSGVNDADTSDESLSVTLEAGPTDVDYSSKTASVSVTITDDDAVMEVSFERSDYSVNEGHGVEVMVKLDPAPDHRVDIQLQKSNMNGTSDGDYYGIPSMLTFERGETEKRFTFFAEPDNESDDGEAVTVSFAALPAMVQEGDPSEATVTLRDNESLSQDGITCIDNNLANIVTVVSGRGVISVPGQIDTWVIRGVDPHRTYMVEILGADSNVDLWGQNVGGGSLTLADPHPVSLFHDEWEGAVGTSEFNPGASDAGTGHNARFIFIFSGFGDYVLKVESFDENGTGSYHVLVRYDNYCIVRDDGSIQFPYEGGPEGYASDVRSDTDTKHGVYDRDGGPSYYASKGHFLGDNWGSMPDEDWFRLELDANTEYEVYLEAASDVPMKHQLTMPRIVGIYDERGDEVHKGAAGSGTDTSVSLTFQPPSTDPYYLAVGSNPGDPTGLYSFYVRHTVSNNVGHAATNNSPTGGPGIAGVPKTGDILTATTSGIADDDGLENASFSYQWVRHDQVTNTDTDIPGETSSTYTVTREDRDSAIKVRVDFTDDGGNYETLTSFALLILPPVNTPATGAPAVNGTVRVGEKLTVDTYAVSDDDGMTNAAFTYQWIRSDGATGTDIEDATSASYPLVDADVGNTIKARVSFTDDAGNPETLTSQATAAVTGAERTEEPEPVQETEEDTEAHEPPEPPRNLTATVNPDGSVSLNWDAPDDDSVTGYQILRRRPGEGEKTLLVYVDDTGSTATSYTDSNLTAGTRHVYRVKAINDAGLSMWSNFARVEVPGNP